MFKITPKPTFTHTVPIMVPVNDGHDEQSLDITFRVLGLKQLAELEPGFDAQRQRAYCDAVVQTFSGLVDDAGKDVPCDASLRERLLDTPYVQIAIMRHYSEAMSKAKTKN